MYLYPYSIRSVRIFIGKLYIFRIKGKAPTFVRAYFYGAVKLYLDFIIKQNDFFDKTFNQKLRLRFKSFCIKSPYGFFRQFHGKFAFLYQHLLFQFFLFAFQFSFCASLSWITASQTDSSYGLSQLCWRKSRSLLNPGTPSISCLAQSK